MNCLSRGIKRQTALQADVTLELTAIATGSGYKTITVVQYVLQLILCSYDLIFDLCWFTFLLIANGAVYGL